MTKQEYEAALIKLVDLWGIDSDEFEILANKIVAYELINHPVPDATDDDVREFLEDQGEP